MLRSNNATERSMWGVGMRSIEVFDLLRDTGKQVVARCVRSIEVLNSTARYREACSGTVCEVN